MKERAVWMYFLWVCVFALVLLAQETLHLTADLANAIGCMLFVGFCYWDKGRVLHFWIAAAMCNALAYTASRVRHDRARAVFVLIGIACIVLEYFNHRTGWWKRLRVLVKSAGLTLVSAASFKRQSKEAFQCTR